MISDFGVIDTDGGTQPSELGSKVPGWPWKIPSQRLLWKVLLGLVHSLRRERMHHCWEVWQWVMCHVKTQRLTGFQLTFSCLLIQAPAPMEPTDAPAFPNVVDCYLLRL